MPFAKSYSAPVLHPLLDQVLADLARRPKRIATNWLYDEYGAELFEEICTLPEYYPTRSELAIMREYAVEMAAAVGPHATLVEFGSGAGMKTRVLLDHLIEPARYIPVDIAQTQLFEMAGRIARDYPALGVKPVCADFTRPFALPLTATERRLIYFPGSTIGNFETESAVVLLKRMGQLAGPAGAILIGVDLRKDVGMLQRAYDDARGVTAAFNLNVLRHLNRSLGANFDLTKFRHRAYWNERHDRIEMHLVSVADQVVYIGDARIHVQADEPIVTEYSHKYTLDSFALLAEHADLQVSALWMDSQRLFSVQLLEPR